MVKMVSRRECTSHHWNILNVPPPWMSLQNILAVILPITVNMKWILVYYKTELNQQTRTMLDIDILENSLCDKHINFTRISRGYMIFNKESGILFSFRTVNEMLPSCFVFSLWNKTNNWCNWRQSKYFCMETWRTQVTVQALCTGSWFSCLRILLKI